MKYTSMDCKTFSQFFELIRSGLWGHDADPTLFDTGTNWQLLYRMAAMQSMTVIFADGVNTLPKGLMPPPDISRRLHLALSGTLHANRLLDSGISDLVTLLRGAGIEGVLLKGQGVARYYTIPEHRMCGDIDFYVGPDAFRRACKLLKASGARPLEESEKHSSFACNGVMIEIHRKVACGHSSLQDRRLQSWWSPLLDRRDELLAADFKGTRVYLPPARFDALFLLYHAANHMITGGVGLRQLCDWCRCLHTFRNSLDLQALESDIRKLKLQRFWKVFAWIAVNRLGLPEDEMPGYSGYGKPAMLCLSIIMKEGNFGHFSDKVQSGSSGNMPSKNRILRKMHTCRHVLGRQLELLRIFPKQVLTFIPKYLVDGIVRVFTEKQSPCTTLQ